MEEIVTPESLGPVVWEQEARTHPQTHLIAQVAESDYKAGQKALAWELSLEEH